MTQMLNLDDFKVERTVVIAGKERTVRAMTVGEFLNADEFDAKFKAANPVEQIGLLVEQIVGFVSDTTQEELRKLEVGQLAVLLNYVRGMEVPDPAAKDAEGNGASPK